MSGGRYWNEDTQRWEDAAPGGPPAAQPTAPPPARPEFAPGPAADGAGTADGPGTAGGTGAPTGAAGATGSAEATGLTGDGEARASGWPGGGPASGWHGPGAGGTVVDGGGAVPGAPAAGAGSWPAYGPGTGGAAWPYGEAGAGAGAGAGGGLGWPAPVELSSEAPAGRSSRRLVWSVVVGAAAVGVVVSLVLTLVVGKNDDPGHGRAAAGTSAGPAPSEQTSSGPPASTASASAASASPSATAPPAGYESHDDEEGFRVAVPEGWTRSTVPSQYGIAVVNYRSPDREHRLQVYQVQESSPAASFRLYLSAETRKPAGFEELDLKTLDDGEFRGSRLEYLADRIKGEPDIGTWHVVDERFFAPDGNIYAIASYGPESDGRDDELKALTTALEWFCPPYTTCDADPALD
ncbi:hypothetical protein [Streptomyces sp. H51]|uniref:hypothetical protein n=1 Tax=Streptomyces sp. H51 TaxID=3111770 RepID=UPI002D77100D|nr:hypothetical protein [Streptomyces sp. H51]